ncbi:MAG TPA: YIP1 family protein [Vicinamibacterales bacterium]|nr:YIP1 family protein [Vicinamibacterales bacterium]
MNQPVPPPAPAKGLIARATGIILSPRATFEDVVRAPRAVGILFLCCLVIGISAAAPQFTERGRQAALDMQVQQTERMMGRPLTDEMYQGLEGRSHYGGYFAIIGVFVGMPIWSLLLAAVFWAIFNALLGGTATFKQVLAVVTHSQVIGALGAAISAPIQLVQGTVSVGGPFNLGALVPMLAETSFVARFLGTVSVFTLWGLFVLAIGLAVLYKRKTTNIAIALIAVYALITAAIIAAFGRMAGG